MLGYVGAETVLFERLLPRMAVNRAEALCLCLALAVLRSVASQTTPPAAAGTQAAAAKAPSLTAPGVAGATICAQGDAACNPALVQPTNDTGYFNCINTPTAPRCTSPSSGASVESSASPEDACPTDPILDQGFTGEQLQIQVMFLTDQSLPGDGAYISYALQTDCCSLRWTL